MSVNMIEISCGSPPRHQLLLVPVQSRRTSSRAARSAIIPHRRLRLLEELSERVSLTSRNAGAGGRRREFKGIHPQRLAYDLPMPAMEAPKNEPARDDHRKNEAERDRQKPFPHVAVSGPR